MEDPDLCHVFTCSIKEKYAISSTQAQGPYIRGTRGRAMRAADYNNGTQGKYILKEEKERNQKHKTLPKWVSLEVSILGGRQVGRETDPCGHPITRHMDAGHWKGRRSIQWCTGQFNSWFSREP